jgi:hypothetical protein
MVRLKSHLETPHVIQNFPSNEGLHGTVTSREHRAGTKSIWTETTLPQLYHHPCRLWRSGMVEPTEEPESTPSIATESGNEQNSRSIQNNAGGTPRG